MRLQIRVNDEGRIEEARFKTFGCGSAIAASSLVTEWVTGKSLEAAESLKNEAIAEELNLPPVKLHCWCWPKSHRTGDCRLSAQAGGSDARGGSQLAQKGKARTCQTHSMSFKSIRGTTWNRQTSIADIAAGSPICTRTARVLP
jgi:hypothetical protein